MSFYETIVLIRQDISSTEVDKIADELKKIIEDGQGKIIKTEYWGLLSLAYEIKNNKKAHYYFMGIEADQKILNELDRRIKLSESIVRSSVVKVSEISSEVSPILREGTNDEGNVVDVTSGNA